MQRKAEARVEIHEFYYPSIMLGEVGSKFIHNLINQMTLVVKTRLESTLSSEKDLTIFFLHL